jgi:phosphoserine phosphatase
MAFVTKYDQSSGHSKEFCQGGNIVDQFMSTFEGKADKKCSVRVFRSLTHLRHRRLQTFAAQKDRSSSLKRDIASKGRPDRHQTRGLPVTKILLIRHGHVEGISPERFRGRADLPLTNRGSAEAHAVAQRVASAWRPTKVYTSPMRRCIATGAAIAQACGLDAQTLDDLNDIDYGAWQSSSYEEIEAAYPQLYSAWFATPHLVRFPDGESLQDLVARSADALRFVLGHHLDDTVVLVSHDSVNRALLLQLLDQPLSSYWRLAQDPCCINEIDLADRHIHVLRINETHHLRSTDGG